MLPAEQPRQPAASGRAQRGPRVWLAYGQRLGPIGPPACPAGGGQQRGPVEQDGRRISGVVIRRGQQTGDADRGYHGSVRSR